MWVSPHFSPEFGFLALAGKGGGTIGCRSIAGPILQGRSFDIRRQLFAAWLVPKIK